MSEIRRVSYLPCVEADLIDVCRSRLPNETCGVIYGAIVNDTVIAEGFAVVRNAAPNPSHAFFFHPEEWIGIFYEAEKNQRSIVGIFHSHPDGGVEPSAEDGRAWTPWGTYWVVSLAGERGAVTAYRKDSRRQWVRLSAQRDESNG
ncbi:hypothetical protein SD71_04335 [Cohnella kolymensis]|uniref:JAB domain-containing protein n=1 Tax=Cohnella kolymensis TaxID=1590652 RepID=A0ABR5A7G2_9BACL|nr:M67 family metallopeptidase [Cohnella kolymensis]KIL36947.1 hypothetical protein SD71_04335 [Cohnella kolymensis]